MLSAGYQTEGFFDEMFLPDGSPRPEASTVLKRIFALPDGEVQIRQQAAERALLHMGITFNVYNNNEGTERIMPLDVVPRIVSAQEWRGLERGLAQRVYALNEFIRDVYGKQRILKDKVIPEELITSATSFRKQCVGLNVPRNIWCHITGTDLVRDDSGTVHVLEDNLRCPSGVSYVLGNRLVMKQTFPIVFGACKVMPVEDYPSRLLAMLQYIGGPVSMGNAPTVAVLTPGPYNSAYFEHSYLAQRMGVELVEGRDLIVADGYVQMRTTRGFQRVDMLYRRIDDDFIDPRAFRPDSMLGVPGLMDVYRAGRVALVNAPGTGIADDKVIYAYVPDMIRYYLSEDPHIPNVPTFVCNDPKQLDHVLQNLDKLVVKAANESGGYGMLIGPHSSKQEQEEFARRLKAAPRNYIAQPTLALSRAPVLAGDHLEGRHVDLRPFILYGESIYVLPGGLTRVALRKGSLVVNSSQGGGSKDTWVVSND
jgi:uncharacterized circularly permuted ATP-grasp superfamily protein